MQAIRTTNHTDMTLRGQRAGTLRYGAGRLVQSRESPLRLDIRCLVIARQSGKISRRRGKQKTGIKIAANPNTTRIQPSGARSFLVGG